MSKYTENKMSVLYSYFDINFSSDIYDGAGVNGRRKIPLYIWNTTEKNQNSFSTVHTCTIVDISKLSENIFQMLTAVVRVKAVLYQRATQPRIRIHAPTV